jgi:hypothetical protein
MTQANQAVTAFGPFFRARAFFVGARLSATFPESVRNQAVALCRSALATPEAGRQAEYPAAYSFIARAVAIHKCKLALVAFAKARHRPQVTARDPASATSELGFRPGFPETPDSYNPPGAPMAAPLPRACGGAFFFRGAA